MSNDILTMYTKYKNRKTGRKGYCAWKNEKVMSIRPCDYGDYVLQHRKKGNKKGD